jgi:hypothetical protein
MQRATTVEVRALISIWNSITLMMCPLILMVKLIPWSDEDKKKEFCNTI